jgi:thiol-disulfide isomerase/thioredoxin
MRQKGCRDAAGPPSAIAFTVAFFLGVDEMNRSIRLTPIRAAIFLVLVCSLVGVVRADSFSSIRWAGPGASSDALKGKTVVMVSFVTWCPICNGWSPEMLAQIKKATEDKPVVVLAIATDVDAAAGKTYMLQHKFVGSNILYGADANVAKEYGVDAKNLWNYVWFDPTGKVTKKGAAGVAYGGANNTKTYVVPQEVNSAKNLGKLEFVSSTMSPDAKQYAWAIELGDYSLLTQISSPKVQRLFNKDDRDALVGMQSRFLAERLASAKENSMGDIPQKIDAFETATQLATHFRATAQAKEAVKIAAALNADPEFRKELTAKTQYNLALNKAGGDDAKLAKLLRAVSVRFTGTYYGDQAKKDSDTATQAGDAADKDKGAKNAPAKSATPKSDSTAKAAVN